MYAQISPGGSGRERLFFVPSVECHNKGKQFVVKIANILVNQNVSQYSRENSLQKVYEEDCFKLTFPRKNTENMKLNRTGKISPLEIETKSTIISKKSTEAQITPTERSTKLLNTRKDPHTQKLSETTETSSKATIPETSILSTKKPLNIKIGDSQEEFHISLTAVINVVEDNALGENTSKVEGNGTLPDSSNIKHGKSEIPAESTSDVFLDI